MPLIEIETNGKIGELILNRPEKLNAFHAEMLDAFEEALNILASNEDVSCVIVRGAGRAFSVGHDMRESARAASAYEDWHNLRNEVRALSCVLECPKPVVACVHGYCMGMAMIVAACSDITIVDANAEITWPQLPLGGGLLGPMSTWLIGPKKAAEFSFIPGSTMSGTEAAELGWANYAVPSDEVLDKAREIARRICATPAGLLRVKKLALKRVLLSLGLREVLDDGALWDALTHTEPGVVGLSRTVRKVGFKQAIADLGKA